MSGLSHYKFGPSNSGGVEISKGSNTSPIQVTILAGQTSADVAAWLCVPASSPEDYYFTDVVVDPVDIDGADESTWVRLTEDDSGSPLEPYGLPGEPLSLGNVGPLVGDFQKHYLKVTVPSGTSAQIKVDVKLRVTATKRATA